MSRKTKPIHWGFDHWCDSSPCGANLPKDSVTVVWERVTCPACKQWVQENFKPTMGEQVAP